MYNLVLEYRVKDFMPIDINVLEKTNYDYNSLEAIDSFCKRYTKDEIMNMIRVNNLVPSEYLLGELKIINEKKYRFEVLYKDDLFSLDYFFKNNISNKIMMNKFVNIYKKYTNKDEGFVNQLIQKGDINNLVSYILELDYLTVRNIYCYLKEL